MHTGSAISVYPRSCSSYPTHLPTHSSLALRDIFALLSCSMFMLKSSSTDGIESHLASYQRCNEVFPQAQRMVTCETLLTDVGGRYLILPCSYASTIAANQAGSGASSSSSSAAATPASFPFILCIYSAHPILATRRALYAPALVLAQQLATMRGESKALSDVSSEATVQQA
jgi:hypothetical protein